MAFTMEFRKGFRIAAGILFIAAAVISIIPFISAISNCVEHGDRYTVNAFIIGLNVLLILIGVMILIEKFVFAGISQIFFAILCIPMIVGSFNGSGTYEIFVFSSVWSVLLLILTLAANGSIAAGLFLQNGKSQWLLLIPGILLLAIPFLRMESYAAFLAKQGIRYSGEWSIGWVFDMLRMVPNAIAWILLGRYFAE